MFYRNRKSAARSSLPCPSRTSATISTTTSQRELATMKTSSHDHIQSWCGRNRWRFRCLSRNKKKRAWGWPRLTNGKVNKPWILLKLGWKKWPKTYFPKWYLKNGDLPWSEKSTRTHPRIIWHVAWGKHLQRDVRWEQNACSIRKMSVFESEEEKTTRCFIL